MITQQLLRWLVKYWYLSLCALLAGLGMESSGLAAVLVGQGPNFTYSYSPRLALALDTNAANVGVAYNRESPANKNCSFVIVTGTTNLSSGTVSYTLVPDPGFAIQQMFVSQRVNLYTSGNVRGEYSLNGGNTFTPFFNTPPYVGTLVALTRQINLRALNATNVTLRYTITRTNGLNSNVQFLRDCDDNPFSFSVSGRIITALEAGHSLLLVAKGSTWKYLDNGSNQNTAWRAAGFDDRTWASGAAEFGYGDGDEVTTNQFGLDPNNKFITTYYRKTFSVTNAAAMQKLKVGLLRDDGAVVYLNGTELFRNNMPAGAITYTTRAVNAYSGADETTFVEMNLSSARLVNGTNVLAVEVHQAAPDSSDISFDLDMVGITAGPALGITWAEGCATLSWADEQFTVQQSPDPNGPWTDLLGPPSSPYTICGGDARTFYRLRGLP